MKKTEMLIVGAVAGVLNLATANAAPQNVQCAEVERCYGVSKAGKNDCATATSACAGTSEKDNQRDAWVYTPKGTCAKLSGGTLTATAAPAPVKKK